MNESGGKLFLVPQVCKLLTEHADTVTDSGRLPGSQAPYVVDGSRWTGYDDEASIKEKVGADILVSFLDLVRLSPLLVLPRL